MAKVKTGGSGGGSSASKRYKLSSRELALMEEQKKREQEQKSKLKALKEQQKKVLAQQLPPSDAKPVKSILKKTSDVSTFVRPTIPSGSASTKPSSSTVVPTTQPPVSIPTATPTSSLTAGKSSVKGKVTRQADDKEESETAGLPEGFFDDPVLDAKARGVAYVDKDEEEWEQFQKEIETEMNVAQTILVEDRTEATVDRQIEEIDEQMQAWQRVNRLEKLKDKVDAKLKPTDNDNQKSKQDDGGSSDDEEDVDEFVDWRKKC